MNACTVITIHSTSHFINCLTITLLLMNSRYSFVSSTLIRKTYLGKHLLLHVILFILNQKKCSRKMHTFVFIGYQVLKYCKCYIIIKVCKRSKTCYLLVSINKSGNLHETINICTS